MLAAVCSAAAAGLWFLVTEQILRAWMPTRWLRIAGALGGRVDRRNGVHGVESVGREREGLYRFARRASRSCRGSPCVGRRSPDHPKADRMLVLMAYLCGLGYANHMAGMLPAPAIALAVLVRRPVDDHSVATAACVRRRDRRRAHAVRDAADSRRAFPRDERGRADSLSSRARPRRARSRSRRTTLFMYNFNRGQYGKPELAQSPGVVRRAGRDVVAVLPLAVAARPAGDACRSSSHCSRPRSSCSR